MYLDFKRIGISGVDFGADDMYNSYVHNNAHAMTKVSVTELRQNLPTYLARVKKGEEIEVAVHGKVIARIVPEHDTAEAARAWLKSLRGKAWLKNVISPSGGVWDAEK